MDDQPARIELLSHRVGWLDRYRRALAILGALILTPLLIWEVVGSFNDGATTVLGVLVGVIVWWFVEIGLVWVTALWETECSQLLRERGLPRATLVRR